MARLEFFRVLKFSRLDSCRALNTLILVGIIILKMNFFLTCFHGSKYNMSIHKVHGPSLANVKIVEPSNSPIWIILGPQNTSKHFRTLKSSMPQT